MVEERDSKISAWKLKLKNAKNCHISIGDSRKMVEVFKEMRPKITWKSRNVQENVFG